MTRIFIEERKLSYVFRRLPAGYSRIGKLVPVVDSVPPKPLLHTQLELEARIGIEPSSKTKSLLEKSVVGQFQTDPLLKNLIL